MLSVLSDDDEWQTLLNSNRQTVAIIADMTATITPSIGQITSEEVGELYFPFPSSPSFSSILFFLSSSFFSTPLSLELGLLNTVRESAGALYAP